MATLPSAPIFNPQIPYVGIINGGFQPGRLVKIQGTVHSTAVRFAINLLCGPNINSGDDIALHFNPRFNENRIIRNSMQRLTWQQEEFHGSSMPLMRGQGFEIVILCDPHHYKIAINGHHFAEFVHRLQFQRVSHINIEGNVDISLITVEGGPTLGGGFAPTAPGVFAPQPGMGVGVPGHPAGGMYPTLPGPGVPPYPSQPAAGAYGQPAAMGYAQQPYPAHGQQPSYPGQTPGYPGQTPGYPGQTAGYLGQAPGQYPSYPSGYNSNQQYPSQPPRAGLGGLLDQAGAAIAGALGSGGLMRGGAPSTGYNYPPPPPPPPPPGYLPQAQSGLGGYLSQAGAALSGALGAASLLGGRSTAPAASNTGAASSGWGANLANLRNQMPKSLNDLKNLSSLLNTGRKF